MKNPIKAYLIHVIDEVNAEIKINHTLELLSIIDNIDKHNLQRLPFNYVDYIKINFSAIYGDFPKGITSIITRELKREEFLYHSFKNQHSSMNNFHRIANLRRNIVSIQYFLKALKEENLNEIPSFYVEQAFIALKDTLRQPLKVISKHYSINAEMYK